MIRKMYFLFAVWLGICACTQKNTKSPKSQKTEISFLMDVYKSDYLNQEKKLFENGFKMASETISDYKYNGYSKGDTWGGNYEFLYLLNDSTTALYYYCTDETTALRLLNQISDGKLDQDIVISHSRAEFHSREFFELTLYKK